MNLNDFLFDKHGRSKASAPTATMKEWMRDYRFELVTNDTIAKVVDECIEAGLYGIDLETTGLDNRVYNNRTVDQIVGICLAPKAHVGYYIPVRHREDGAERNVSISLVESEIKRLSEANSVGIFHNAKFDLVFLEHSGMGMWDSHKGFEDTFILAYLSDTRMRRKGLKYLTNNLLGLEMIELKELFPQDHKGKLDYSLLDPSLPEVLAYAASDAVCTYMLFKEFHPKVIGDKAEPDQSVVYAMEKGCLAATRWMEKNKMPTDREVIKELIKLGQQEMFDSLEEVYVTAKDILGREVAPSWFYYLKENFDPSPTQPIKDQIDNAKNHEKRMGVVEVDTVHKEVKSLLDGRKTEIREFPFVYDILSAKQLGTMMWEMGVGGLKVTDKSREKHEADSKKDLQIKTTKDEMDRLMNTMGDKFPFMNKIKRFRETQKALSTNLLPMYEDADENGDLRINFKQQGTDTGRFTTPGTKDRGEGLHGGTRFNLHSLPSTYDPNRPECMRRLRECIKARDGMFLAAIDFSGEELRIVTNLSGEPLWLEQFFRCSDCDTHFDRKERPPKFCPNCGSDKIGDLHSLTALSIFGKEAKKDPRWKALRGQGKATNFALCYGGGRGAVMRAVGVDENEGARIKAQFDKTYKGLSTWWGQQKEKALKKGWVQTSFGRKYPVPDALLPKRGMTHGIPNSGLIAKAQRNSINGPIQGTGADILKIAMWHIYHEAKKRDWLDRARILACMHDEILFEIEGEILEEAIDVYTEIMAQKTVASRRWRVPLTVDVEIGKNWKVPYDLYAIRNGEEEMPEELAPYLNLERIKESVKDKAPEEEKPEEIQLNGGVFEFVITKDKSYGLGDSLAKVLFKANNSGTKPLRVLTRGGGVILDVEDGFLVNPYIFTEEATVEGLV